MKYLIIIDSTNPTSNDLFRASWEYIAKIQDEDFTKVTDAIESVTDTPKKK